MNIIFRPYYDSIKPTNINIEIFFNKVNHKLINLKDLLISLNCYSLNCNT